MKKQTTTNHKNNKDDNDKGVAVGGD